MTVSANKEGVGYRCLMTPADALSRKSEKARALFWSVCSYRHIANVSIERAVELHMSLCKIDMAEFDNMIRMYNNVAHDAQGLIEVPGMCKKCPEA